MIFLIVINASSFLHCFVAVGWSVKGILPLKNVRQLSLLVFGDCLQCFGTIDWVSGSDEVLA